MATLAHDYVFKDSDLERMHKDGLECIQLQCVATCNQGRVEALTLFMRIEHDPGYLAEAEMLLSWLREAESREINHL